MFDIAPTELMLVAIVALLVIGPKDLPKAMRFVGHWVSKARGVARQFRSGFDTMVREAELAEMEKKWAEENARIMREHPPEAPAALTGPGAAAAAAVAADASNDASVVAPADHPSPLDDPAPLMVEQPVVGPALADTPVPADEGKAIS